MSKRRFVYYQPNKKDLKDKVGDCQIRALSKALGLTWVEAFDITIPICRELQTYTFFDCDLNKTKEAMSRLGFGTPGSLTKKVQKDLQLTVSPRIIHMERISSKLRIMWWQWLTESIMTHGIAVSTVCTGTS